LACIKKVGQQPLINNGKTARQKVKNKINSFSLIIPRPKHQFDNFSLSLWTNSTEKAEENGRRGTGRTTVYCNVA